MGLNVAIYIKAWDKSEPVVVHGFTVDPFCFGEIDPPILHAAGLSRDGYYPEGPWQATHRINPYLRYYSPDCQRGPWDDISKLLRTVMDAENVRSVWYLSDDDDYPFRAPISGFDIDQMENFYASSMGDNMA